MIKRVSLFMAALLVVVTTGWLHGLWTQRWCPSHELQEAVARLEQIPETFPSPGDSRPGYTRKTLAALAARHERSGSSARNGGKARADPREALALALQHQAWTERGTSASSCRENRSEGAEWKVTPYQIEARFLEAAGAKGHWIRQFTNETTGQVYTVILLVGQPGPMSVHRPEHCYQGAGYEMESRPTAVELQGEVPARLWTTTFVKPRAEGPLRLRIFWTWFADHRWEAPSWPRFTFARHHALYKLYIVHEISGESETAGSPAMEDSRWEFVQELLSVLRRALAKAEGGRRKVE